MVRDLDLAVHDATDSRRLEVIADGLSLHGGAQLAIDTTLVSALRCDRTPDPQPLAFRAPRLKMHDDEKNLAGEGGRARLVVLAMEVDGSLSAETRHFLGSLAKDKARSAPLALQSSAATAWFRRWSAILVSHRAPVSSWDGWHLAHAARGGVAVALLHLFGVGTRVASS